MQDQSIKQALDALMNRGETRSIIEKSKSAHRERIMRLERLIAIESLAINRSFREELFLLEGYHDRLVAAEPCSHALHILKAALAATWKEHIHHIQKAVDIAKVDQVALQPLVQAAKKRLVVQFTSEQNLTAQAKGEFAQQAIEAVQNSYNLGATLQGQALSNLKDMVQEAVSTLPWQAVVNIKSEPTAEGGVVTAQLSLT